MSTHEPMIVSKECCDCQEVDNNDLGPCDDCGGGCEVTLSISTPTLSCDGVDFVATVNSTVPAGETVTSLTFDYGHWDDDVDNTYVGGQETDFSLSNLLLSTPTSTSIQVVLVTDVGTTCTSNMVLNIPTHGGPNDGWVLRSTLYEETWSSTYADANVMSFDDDDVYPQWHPTKAGQPMYDSATGGVYAVPHYGSASVGTPCGCEEQCFTVSGDFHGVADKLTIMYKKDKFDAQPNGVANWVEGDDWEGSGIFSNKKFNKPAGYGWMAFKLNEYGNSHAWDFTATRTYGACP